MWAVFGRRKRWDDRWQRIRRYEGRPLRFNVRRLPGKKQVFLEGKTVYITGSVCEEYCDGVCLEHFYAESNVKPDFCIICEPSNNIITLGHTGKLQARIKTHGVSAHGSAPEK